MSEARLDRKPAPDVGGAQEELLHERASATPMRERAERAHVDVDTSAIAGAETLPAVSAPLRSLQEWFAAVVTFPASLDDGSAMAEWPVERVLTRGPQLSARERLGVYHYAYRARLVECLIDDYPGLNYAIGEDAFDALAGAYIVRHPSRHPSLNGYGQHLASFVRDEYVTEAFSTSFAHDLARLEWALVEVLHAAAAPTLSLEALQAVPPTQWAGARLPKADTLRLLRFTHPVNAFFQAFRHDKSPTIPSPEPSVTAVYRHGWTLWRMDLTPAMARVLEALFAGATLGEALGKIETDESDEASVEEASRNVMAWFREWVSGGFFGRIDVGG